MAEFFAFVGVSLFVIGYALPALIVLMDYPVQVVKEFEMHQVIHVKDILEMIVMLPLFVGLALIPVVNIKYIEEEVTWLGKMTWIRKLLNFKLQEKEPKW